jgi:hypothetical protein
MIIQSSNKPIIIDFSEDMTDNKIRVTLWDNKGIKLKEWINADLTIEENIVTASLTQEETANFPECMARLEIKWLNSDGITEFAKNIAIRISDKNDKEVMEV